MLWERMYGDQWWDDLVVGKSFLVVGSGVQISWSTKQFLEETEKPIKTWNFLIRETEKYTCTHTSSKLWGKNHFISRTYQELNKIHGIKQEKSEARNLFSTATM